MGYTNSSLITYRKISPNRSSPRNHTIDTITIHCMAGNLSIESCGNLFSKSSTKASSNYGIGSDGRIALYVEEKDRSWASSSRSNDNRAVTIEVANDGGANTGWHVSDKAMESLINLCADICKRNNIKELKWKADKSLIGQVSKQNMTVHRWFANKSCPGDYLYNKHYYIAEQVNKKLSGNTDNVSIGTAISNIYTVVKGDTLVKIGNKTGISWGKIAEMNNIKSPYTINIGQKLKLYDTSNNKSNTNSVKNNTVSPSQDGNSIIKLGQQHANNFAKCELVADGIRGGKTRKAAVKVVQRALNADYNAGLVEDGIWGNTTDKAFGNHYVKVGETQYLVTALEILCMLKGKNPNGVECPGKFGNGLASACGTSKAYKNTFKSFCS